MISYKERIQKIIIKRIHIFGYILNKFGFKTVEPVFIVGSGRCGTSLLMKILNSHPDITVFPGEANNLWHPKLYPINKSIINAHPIEFDPIEYTRISLNNWPPNNRIKIKNTFNGYHFLMGKSKVFVVKSAMISFMIPQIVKIFPNAKFVHLYRNGPSTIDSYFKKNFGIYTNYSYSEDEYYKICAEYWNSCILEIEKAKNKFQNKNSSMFELSYEKLCENPVTATMNLSKYLNIDMEKFSFDLSKIKNTNSKAKKSIKLQKISNIIEDIISPAMKLKGYI